jgi:hypothetical protein
MCGVLDRQDSNPCLNIGTLSAMNTLIVPSRLAAFELPILSSQAPYAAPGGIRPDLADAI